MKESSVSPAGRDEEEEEEEEEEGGVKEGHAQKRALRKGLQSVRVGGEDRRCRSGIDKARGPAEKKLLGAPRSRCCHFCPLLTRAVGCHHSPVGLLAHPHGHDGLGHGADLVHLEQQRVARLALDGGRHALGVGDQQVVPHDLDAHVLGQGGVVVEIVLSAVVGEARERAGKRGGGAEAGGGKAREI